LFNEITKQNDQESSITIEEARAALARVDFDNDQIIEFSDFLMIIGDRQHILSEINLINLFNQLDEDEQTRVPLSDVRTIFQVSASRLTV
jgi:Ca2+-binding EF-hand superfamily protein